VAGNTESFHMRSDLSSALEVCIDDDALYKSTYTLLLLYFRVRVSELMSCIARDALLLHILLHVCLGSKVLHIRTHGR